MRAIPANDLAEQILYLRKDTETTPMHVIKLVYLCHGWCLGVHGERLIQEDVEAWKYGPVVPANYHKYAFRGNGGVVLVPSKEVDGIDGVQKELINRVLDIYSEYDALQLSTLTHQDGTPWHKTIESAGVGSVIPEEVIKDYYAKRTRAVA